MQHPEAIAEVQIELARRGCRQSPAPYVVYYRLGLHPHLPAQPTNVPAQVYLLHVREEFSL